MISDRAYIISNQEGLKVSRIYEEGFNSTDFNNKSYYSLNDIIDNIDKYDPVTGKPNSDFPIEADTSIEGPGEKELQKLIKIGEGETKGIFCEKPPLHIGNIPTTVFPLGSPGASGDIKESSRGFGLDEFFQGGLSPDEYVENIPEKPIEGIVFNHGFKKDSNYDNQVLYTFEGANISEKKNLEDINFLKFPEDPEYMTESVTLPTVYAGDKLSYTPEVRGDKGLLNVSITCEDGSSYTDFYLESNNLIVGKNAVAKDTTFTITCTYHRYFRGRNGKTGINWPRLDVQSGEETSKNNFLRSSDLVNLKAVTNNNIVHFFLADVSLSEAGNYYFSLYARNKSSDKDAYLYGIALVPKTVMDDGNRISLWGGVSYLNTLESTSPLCTETSLKRVFSYYESNTTYSNISGCKLLKTWKRISRYLPSLSAGDYKALVWATSAEGKSQTPGEFSICGMKIEKESLTPYDYRTVDYTYRPLLIEGSEKSHVLYFNFKELVEGQKLNTTSWTISYLRKFEGCKEDNQSHLDSIGNTSFGYKGSKIVYGNKEIESSEKGIPDLNSLYNNWERVVITHKKDLKSVDIKVINSGNYRQGIKSISYTLEGVGVTNFLPTVPDSQISEGSSSLDSSTLILGGSISNSKINTFNGIYRNLYFFEGDIGKKGLADLEKQTLDIFINTRTSIPNGNTKEKEIVLRGDFLQEEI